MKDVKRKNKKSDTFSDADVSPMNVNINIECKIDPTNRDGLKCRISRDPVPDETDEDTEWSPFKDEDDSEVVENKESQDDDKKRKDANKKHKSSPKKVRDEDGESDEENDDDLDENENRDDEDLDEDDDEDDEDILECVQKSTMKKR